MHQNDEQLTDSLRVGTTTDHNGVDATPVARALFRTADLPESERFGVWRDSVLPLFDSTPAEAHSSGLFSAQVESFDLEQLFLGMSAFSPLNFRREKNHPADEGADHLVVQLYLSGGYIGYNGCRKVHVEAGDVSILDLGRLVETTAAASTALTLVVPRDLVFSMVNARQLAFGTVLKAGSSMARILGQHLLEVWKALPSASLSEIPGINRTLVGSVVGAFDLDPVSSEPVRNAWQDATAEAIQAYIRQNLDCENLGPDHLCSEFGCSRAQLYRLFASLGGVAAYIRERRLARCREELTQGLAGRTKLVDIAMRWGFASQSHFCRAFRQAFGISPSEAMEQGRQSVLQSISLDGPAVHSAPQFHQWLRRL